MAVVGRRASLTYDVTSYGSGWKKDVLNLCWSLNTSNELGLMCENGPIGIRLIELYSHAKSP